MNEMKLEQLEYRIPALLVISSEANGLYYGALPTEKHRLAIIGDSGITMVTVEQAAALAKEIVEMFKTYAGKGRIPFGKEMSREYREKYRDILQEASHSWEEEDP